MTQRAIELINLNKPAHLRSFDCPDPITGMTADRMVQLVDEADAPDWAKAASISICRSYGINGLCDFAYIANTIRAEYNRRSE